MRSSPIFRRWKKVFSLLPLLLSYFVHSFATLSESRRQKNGILFEANKLSSEDIRERIRQETERLQEKDRKSLLLKPKDDHLVVVNKPPGVICVSSEDEVPSLAKAVHARCKPGDVSGPNQMVVHRLGSDTSGLIVLAKSLAAVRGMNALFRTRKITRKYEALLCGHLKQDEGIISLPLMKDYEHPPYMRVSTDEHQKLLLDLDPEVVGKKLLEAPKTAMTHYMVEGREFLAGNDELPVTRVSLLSISGRTHQLNVHCAASGHPIVGDNVYGRGGSAAEYGGLEYLPGDRAPDELQDKISCTSESDSVCVHAKMLSFRHPITKEPLEFSVEAPF